MYETTHARRRLPPTFLTPTLTQSRSLRVGVVGAGKVLFKSWPAIHSAGHRVVYVGCRDTARASKMAEEIIEKIAAASGDGQNRDAKSSGAPMPPVSASPPAMPQFGTYEDVVSAGNVDVVYITLPVALRDRWVQASMAAGKHVVGEKPAAASCAELMGWLELANQRRLLYMDGTMLTHSPRTRLVAEKVRQLGTLQHITANFSFLGSESFIAGDIRCRTDLEPHGALGDVGWYAIRWILELVDYELPTHASGRITAVSPPTATTPGGAITAFEGHLTFPPRSSGGKDSGDAAPVTATFHCSFLTAYQQSVTAYTSGGTVEVHGGINPTAEDHPHFVVRTAAPAKAGTGRLAAARAEKVYSTPEEVDGSWQAVQLWRSVGDSLVQLGAGEPLIMDAGRGGNWGRYAYITQLVMDRVLESATMSAAPAPSE